MSTVFDRLIDKSLKTELDYEFWPADDETSRATLIVLHGRGDSREGFEWLPESLGIEALNYLFINAPDPYGPGFSWYDLPPNQSPGVRRSRDQLFELIDALQAAPVGLKASEIFLFGFSQGSLMSLDVALRYPKLLGGVVGVSGYVHFLSEFPEALSAVARHQHFFVSHGLQDDVLPIENTRVSVTRLQELGAHIDWREYEKDHTIDTTTEIPDIKEFLERMLDLS